MPLVRRIASLAFLAFWLTAMLHCRLEAAGLFFESECCNSAARSTTPAADHGCADDLCEVAEGVFTRPDEGSSSAPQATIGYLNLPLIELTPAPVDDFVCEVTGATTAPPGLNRPWALLVFSSNAPQAP